MNRVVDDPSIENYFRLLRRIPIKFNLFIVWDNNIGDWKISSQAFRDHNNGTPMSVHVKEILHENGLSVDSVLEGHEEFALAYFTAGAARDLDQAIVKDPKDGAPAHAHVIGNKTKSVQKSFAKIAEWEIPPPEFPVPPT